MVSAKWVHLLELTHKAGFTQKLRLKTAKKQLKNQLLTTNLSKGLFMVKRLNTLNKKKFLSTKNKLVLFLKIVDILTQKILVNMLQEAVIKHQKKCFSKWMLKALLTKFQNQDFVAVAVVVSLLAKNGVKLQDKRTSLNTLYVMVTKVTQAHLWTGLLWKATHTL